MQTRLISLLLTLVVGFMSCIGSAELVLETFSGCTNSSDGFLDIFMEPHLGGVCQIFNNVRYIVDCVNNVRRVYSDSACANQLGDGVLLDGICRDGVRKQCKERQGPFVIQRYHHNNTRCSSQLFGLNYVALDTCFANGVRNAHVRFEKLGASGFSLVTYDSRADCEANRAIVEIDDNAPKCFNNSLRGDSDFVFVGNDSEALVMHRFTTWAIFTFVTIIMTMDSSSFQ